MIFPTAKRLVGLDKGFEISSPEQYEFAVRVVNEKIVEARRANNDADAARFSEVKALFKKRWFNRHERHCPTCGEPKSLRANLCRSCSNIKRNYPNRIFMEEPKEYEIESSHLVPPCHLPTTPLSKAIYKLANEGQIGDSFVADKPSSTIKNIARLYGVEVICRKTEGLPGDRKKIRVRVWRSDGLDEDAVNDIIKKRLAGQAVPTPKKCVPKPQQKASDAPEKRKAGRPPASRIPPADPVAVAAVN